MSETVLHVDRWYSRCGACGKNADAYEKAHDMMTMEGEGCGATFTAITASSYWADEAAMARRLYEMRPDLAPAPPAEAAQEVEG